MISKGCFVIADITGYTAFLTGSELDHAQDILKSLFDTLLEQLKPPLIISNFQGDAILSYIPEGGILQGQTVLELVENVYFAFLRKRENIQHATTCTCRACANIHSLDLKFFVHHGEYVLQDMQGKSELNGPDVIIAHRMMKNTVKEETGLRAYALFTDAAVQTLGLGGMCVQMQAHTESYEHIGDVAMWIYSLADAWQRERERHPVKVEPESAWVKVEADFDAPPALIWDILNKPDVRVRWMGVEGMTISNLNQGRVGVGSVNHCAHGENAETLMTILDWHPFDYVTLDTSYPLRSRGMYTTYLQPTATGTRVTWALEKPQGVDLLGKLLFRASQAKFHQLMEQIYFGSAAKIRELSVEMLNAQVTFPPTTEQAN